MTFAEILIAESDAWDALELAEVNWQANGCEATRNALNEAVRAWEVAFALRTISCDDAHLEVAA